MSKKFKSQASSSRAAASALGGFGNAFGGASSTLSAFGSSAGAVSSLSYITEPPDLTTISEPDVVVAFKNLSKKDSTTKAKALEELQDFVVRKAEGNSTLEDGFLKAWFNVYPRLSIETTRRVRQVAHAVHGVVVSSAGKRVARLMPKIIGAWLAGLYDNDRPVMRAAQESLLQAFTTDAKRQGVWKAYQGPILDFVEDAILVQTPHTLSDDRSTKPDDMEMKHARVVATASYTCSNLLARLSPDELENNSEKLQTIIPNKKLWTFAHHDDAFVRRATYALLQAILPMADSFIDWKIISSSVLSKALAKSQTGSSLEFVNLLVALTEKQPSIWTSDYTGKKSASSRLSHYLKNGSESAPAAYWEAITKLLHIIPSNVFGSSDGYTLDDATSIMDALHEAFLSRDEYRPNLSAAWTCYISTASRFARQLTNDNDKRTFVKKKMFPILEQYHSASNKDSEWTIPSGSAMSLSTECFINTIDIIGKDRVIAFWKDVTDQLILAVKISKPEESTFYMTDQDAICVRSKRYFTWESHVVEKTRTRDDLSFIPEMFKNASKPLLKDSISLLTSRNGKPYGAAATVEHLTATQFLQGLNYDVLNPFIADQLPELVLSPSGSRLISVLFLCRDSESFNPALSKILDILKDSDVQIVPSSLLQALFSSVSADDFSSYPILQDYSKKICTSLIFDVRKDWSDIAGVLENPASPDDLKISMAEDIIFHLYTRRVLEGIFALVNKSENILRLFAHGPTGAKLIFRLLYLSENDDEDAEDIITSLLQKTEHVRGEEDQAKTAIEILQRNFASANKTLLSVDAMIDVAEDAISASSDPSKTLIQLLPSAAQWSDALEPFLNLPPFLAETQWNSLGGLAAVVPREGPIGRDYRVVQVFDDEKGLTAAWRLASYVTRIFNGRSLDSPDEETRSTLFTYVPLVAQIINCDVSIPESRKTRNAFWGEHVIDEAVEIVSQSRALMKSWTDGSDALFDHWEGLIGNLSGDSPKAYNFAETYVNVVSGKESWKAQDVEKRLQWARKLKTQEDPFVLAAILAAYQDAVASHPLGVRLCNELVADLTSMSSESKEAIPKLVQLRSLGRQPLERVQNQRLVILVNRLISRLEDSLDQTALATEITLVLYEVLPLIKEMYGSQWSAMFDVLQRMWDMTEDMTHDRNPKPLIHASLRLFTRLRSLSTDGEANDDLADAWAEAQKTLSEGIIKVFRNIGPLSASGCHPRGNEADLLTRTVSYLSAALIEDPANLLPMLNSSKPAQLASYNLYRQTIPKAMEDLALEVALGEKKADLPQGLLKHLSWGYATKSLRKKAEWFDLNRRRSYLLTWRTIFDFFEHASITVKDQLTAEIKERGLVPAFLDYLYELLQLPNGRLIDGSKFDLRAFKFDQSTSDEKEEKWFGVHVYYLCLRYLPNLVTAWWNESKNRVKGPIEAWTEKYFSPLVIEDALKTVQEWASSQDWSNEDQSMDVKVSFNAKEIVASIEIDEDSPPSSICISMPSAYPLHLPVVEGRTRIAVSEKKWQSWIRTIAGAVKFQGSLIDALIIFRRNIQGALKGQTECAICYSVVSPSMKLPNKKCATCKNTFHSDCLFRWFTSSNASSCPLCRNNFIYS